MSWENILKNSVTPIDNSLKWKVEIDDTLSISIDGQGIYEAMPSFGNFVINMSARMEKDGELVGSVDEILCKNLSFEYLKEMTDDADYNTMQIGDLTIPADKITIDLYDGEERDTDGNEFATKIKVRDIDLELKYDRSMESRLGEQDFFSSATKPKVEIVSCVVYLEF